MSNIPEARERIDSLMTYVNANENALDADQILLELVSIKSMLYRKSPVRRADPHSQPMTPELAASIRAFAKRNEGMPLQIIGQRFNVNAGRVTEVLQAEQEGSA